MARYVAEKGDPGAAVRDQMLRGIAPARDIVAADRRADRIAVDRAPTHEMRALSDELFEPGAVQLVIAIAEQDDPVGLAAVLVIHVPIGRRLLESKIGRAACRDRGGKYG